MRFVDHVKNKGEMKNTYKVLVGKPEGKRPVGRSRRRCEHKTEMQLKERKYKDMAWIQFGSEYGTVEGWVLI
jgi:radical SAM superfamily enzyme YgiQ (UPF0313 family)